MSGNDNIDEAHALSESEAQDVQHLREIAGGIGYLDALKLLEESSWNLERAVHKLMGFEDSGLRQRSLLCPFQLTPQVELIPPNQRILRSRNSTHSWWWSTALFLFEPIRLGCSLLFGIVKFFSESDLFELSGVELFIIGVNSFYRNYFPCQASFLWSDPRNQVTDPVGDVRNFIQHFKETYGSVNTSFDVDGNSNPTESSTSDSFPPFFEGTYADAVQEAKQSLRFLIVYLHGDSHEDTHRFCKDILQSEDVLRFLRNSNELLFWGCNIESPEGYRVSRTLREHTYPFIGVIGLTNIPSFLNFVILPISFIILRSTPSFNRSEREMNAQLRREQDLAYEASLAEDRAKVAAREAQQRSAALVAEQLAKDAKRKEDLKKAHINRKRIWQSRLPPPPKFEEGSTVQLSFKMPRGSRVSRVFNLNDSIKVIFSDFFTKYFILDHTVSSYSSVHSITLIFLFQLLYYFVLSQDDSPTEFEVQSNFPKRIIPCQPFEESDVEDYIDTPDNKMDCDEPEVITDWSRKCQNDPPSFFDIDLTRPEMLFVLNKDA
ncbi:FAS-associated factor 2 [Schistosoma bovis]|uniref:FAS-associated factor 2 n=2 Tax=Schistosoma bovis TaxID=6184 RepID=A0A430QAX6_SCHBO|nr:FAS-associated factor 2 [Schistosoma bovis]